jgi:hypothetical protein
MSKVYLIAAILFLSNIVAFGQSPQELSETVANNKKRVQEFLELKKNFEAKQNQYKQKALLSNGERFKNRIRLTESMKEQMRSRNKQLLSSSQSEKRIGGTNNITPVYDNEGNVKEFIFGADIPENIKNYFNANKDRFGKPYWENKLGVKPPQKRNLPKLK